MLMLKLINFFYSTNETSLWHLLCSNSSTSSILGPPPVLYLFKLQPHYLGPVGNLESPKQGHT